MTVREYVDDVLCVPVTRIGNRLIVEAIELVLDTHDHKFYQRLSEVTGKTTRYLEKAIRDSKLSGLQYMSPELRQKIFKGDNNVATNEYIVKAAEYYRKMEGK